MACYKSVNVTNNKDIVTNKQLDLSKFTTNKTITKNITAFINICVDRFSDIKGFKVSSVVTFSADILLALIKKFHIESSTTMQTAVTILAKKKIQIDSSIAFNSALGLSKRTNGHIDSEVDLTFGSEAILEELDSLTLGELDIFTLGSMGFSEGVNFILVKKLNIPSNIVFSTTVDLLRYSYTRLSVLDPQTLGALDTQTLEDLDRTIII